MCRILLIDVLAARSTQRVNTTIQLTDTGVSPGAGIGNRRQPLSPQTLGVPVIALGVPTVVDGRTMVLDEVPDAAPQDLETLSNLYVTPKNMDAVALRLSSILSGAINRYLHHLSHEDLKQYLY
ncbi:MAG: GPR endopeptidase [Firmicutes bacterium]|nr:GPR endopeptidase [Bacillota bacterium]